VFKFARVMHKRKGANFNGTLAISPDYRACLLLVLVFVLRFWEGCGVRSCDNAIDLMKCSPTGLPADGIQILMKTDIR